MRLRLCLWVTLLAAIGCGSDSPSSPTPQPPTSLTVSLGISSVFTEHTTTATATAKTANGTLTVVTPTWSSDKTSVATVSQSGVVTATGSGTASIVASYQGLTGSAMLTVTPNFTGTWKGIAQVESCEGFYDPRTCGRFVPSGTTADVTMVLVQDGNGVRGSLDYVTNPPPGLLASPRHYAADMTGSFDAAGVLVLEGYAKNLTTGSPVSSNNTIRTTTHIASGSQDGSVVHTFLPTESWETLATVTFSPMALKK